MRTTTTLACAFLLTSALIIPSQIRAQSPSDEEIVRQSKERAEKKKADAEAAREAERKYRAGAKKSEDAAGSGKGLPSEGKWKQQYDEKTSSNSRTYVDEESGAKVTFNPKTQEVRRNPGSGRFEVVESESADDSNESKSETSAKTPDGEPSTKSLAKTQLARYWEANPPSSKALVLDFMDSGAVTLDGGDWRAKFAGQWTIDGSKIIITWSEFLNDGDYRRGWQPLSKTETATMEGGYIQFQGQTFHKR
jgi:hypothetical protein